MAEEPPVELEYRGPVAHMVLNRPDARNAVNLPMCLALQETLATLDAKADVRAVVLRSNGPVFCAGADLKERQDKDAAWVRERRKASFAAYRAIERCRVPVVALLHGAVVGSGAEIALACDFAIATTDATFRFPEPHWGTVGATQRLQRAIGRRKAKELLFTNTPLSAADAERLGLVVQIVAPDQLLERGDEVARRIIEAPPLAIALTKRAIDLGGDVDLDTGIQIEMAAIEQCLADGGWRESVEAFARVHGAAGADA